MCLEEKADDLVWFGGASPSDSSLLGLPGTEILTISIWGVFVEG